MGALLLTPASVQAQEDSDNANPIVQAYANDMNISYEEAERRLNLQNEMSDLEREIIDHEPSYGGSWMQHQPEFGLVVSFAAPNGEEIIEPYLVDIEWAGLVAVQQSKYTDEEYLEILHQVLAVANQFDLVYASGISLHPNADSTGRVKKITFYTPEPEAFRQLMESQDEIIAYIDDIAYVYQENEDEPADSAEGNSSKATFLPLFF